MLFGFAVLVKLRNFSNPWSRPKDIRLFWLLNYNDLHEDTHHYGPSDPVGSFCGIAEKQLYLITYGSVDAVGGVVSFHSVSVSRLLFRRMTPVLYPRRSTYYKFICGSVRSETKVREDAVLRSCYQSQWPAFHDGLGWIARLGEEDMC